jgi:hypothetical protein
MAFAEDPTVIYPAKCDWWIACFVVPASLVPIGIAYGVVPLVNRLGPFRFRVPLNPIWRRGFRPVVGRGAREVQEGERTPSLARVDFPTG